MSGFKSKMFNLFVRKSHLLRGQLVKETFDENTRITSYNVCYTKLLRLRPNFVLTLSNRTLSSRNPLKLVFRISDKTLGEECSGATFSLPDTNLEINNSRYSLFCLFTDGFFVSCKAMSYLTPLPMLIFLIPSTFSDFL